MLRRNILKFVMAILSLVSPLQTLAQTPMNLVNNLDDDIYRSRISEYFYMRSARDILKPVKVLGSVSKPGLYHIPANTSLTGLLALTGGPNKDADIHQITVARKDGSVEVKDLMKIVKPNQDVVLGEGDLIYVPEDKGLISSSTSNAILVTATVLSVIFTGVLVINSK